VLLGIGTLAVLVVPLVRVLRGLDDEERRRATWMLVGSVVALAPVLSVEASKRLLCVSMVGVSGVVGLLLDRIWFPDEPPERRGLAELSGLLAVVLGFAHFVRAPIETIVITRNSTRGAETYESRADWLQQHLDPHKRSTVIVVRGDSSETVLWGPFVLRDLAPERWRVLSFLSGRELLLRTGPRTVELVQSERPLFAVGPDDLFRNVGSLNVGDSVELPGMRATLMQADEHGLPKRVRFELLDRDADDPSVQWIAEGADGFREETLPPVGYGAPVLP
jgi:hypothetical protein